MSVLVLLALALSPFVKADGISDVSVTLGTANAILGFTPIADSNSGFGRFFLSYTLNGSYNGFVFWNSSNEPQSFTVYNSQITFLPGTYAHYFSGQLLETLTISACGICSADIFSFNRGQFIFSLPTTTTAANNPNYTTLGGDEYYIYNIPVQVSAVPPLPEPSTLPLLCVGLVGLVTYKLLRR
jgi:hypothetical protein